MKRATGQVTVFMVVLLPLLLLLGGIIYRSGQTMLIHHQAQNHCDKKVLDALAVQGKGLHALGLINPFAKAAAVGKWVADFLLVAEVLDPEFIPLLERVRKVCKGGQEAIEGLQRLVKGATIARAASVLRRQGSGELAKGTIEDFGPWMLLPHRMPNALLLHVQKQKAYKNETGAPLELDKDFAKRQIARGEIRIRTESFLQRWLGSRRADDMFLQCKARIEMKTLEDPWEVRLTEPAKPSLKRRWLSYF